MDHLSAAQIAELRQRLEDEREQLLVRQSSQGDDANTVQLEPGDIQDHASEEARRSLAQRRFHHDEARLKEVEAALLRMDDGSYGVCEETGDEIPWGRLRAEPTVRTTVEAQEQVEQQQARTDVAGRLPDDRDAY
jgi:DnaK suppressor protein